MAAKLDRVFLLFRIYQVYCRAPRARYVTCAALHDVPGEGGSPYNGLYGEAPPEGGNFGIFTTQGI